MRRLYDDSFHEWKVIPLKLLNKNPLDNILNFALTFYLISLVLMIFHPFTYTSSVTGKNITQPIQKLHRAFYLNIFGLISL